MTEPHKPVPPLPAPGSPPGYPPVIWSERGARTGEALPDRRLETLLGLGFLALWRLTGLVLLPLACLHPRARRHLCPPAPSPGRTWLHGASAGEHTAARALQPYLDEGAWRTSSSMRTPVAGAFPAPLDLPFVVNRWLDRARPARLVLVEGELWPGWLHACRRRGIPVAVVNARPGRGTARWKRLGPLWRWLVRGVTFVDQAETGDLKLAAQLREATFRLGRDAFVGASTRRGDEARLLDAWKRLPEPRPMLVLAPRHPARFDEVAELIAASGVRWCRRTEGVDPQADVLLLDTIGELAGLFMQARAAFVGGTFDEKLGGHSPAEAFAAGLAVVHGPHTHANPVAWTQGIAIRAEGDLAPAMRSALSIGPRTGRTDESAVRCAARLPSPRIPPERPARPWLWPLVPAWRALASRVPRAVEVDVPVVSVGALSAVGAGKTPAAAWLAAQVQGAWVVARGYRRAGGNDVRVGLPDGSEATGARALGDELEMLRRRGLAVVSAPDRVAGAREAARRGARLVVLDDGFQHRRLHRDLDIVCIDARWPRARGPIPVGEAREPWSALDRADWLWLHHAEFPVHPELPDKPLVRAHLRPVGWLVRGERLPLSAVEGAIDVAVGIGRPEAFVCTLLDLGLQIRSLRIVRDHHLLGDLPPGCVVTEKDAARLPPDADVRALLMEVEVSGADALLGQVRALSEGGGGPAAGEIER